MTPDEIKLLEAAKARIEAKRAGAMHEALRARGVRPNVSLQQHRELELMAAATQSQARALLTVALRADVAHEQRLEAAKAAVAALPLQLEQQLVEQQRKKGRGGWSRPMKRSLREVADAVRAALELGRRGHLAQRGDASTYVQQEDLEDLVPDGWGRSFPLETKRLGRRAGVPPLAVPLLCLLIWCSKAKDHDPKDPRRCGAGLQCSIDWLARKLGCSDTWVKHLLNRLDPHAEYRRELALVRKLNARLKREGKPLRAEPPRPRGTPYVHRFRRLQLYSATPQRDGKRNVVWLDHSGKARTWVDVRGVCYVTDAGRALLVRRATPAAPKPGEPVRLRPNGALTDLSRRLLPVSRLVQRRLAQGSSAVRKAVENATRKTTGPPLPRASSLKRVAT